MEQQPPGKKAKKEPNPVKNKVSKKEYRRYMAEKDHNKITHLVQKNNGWDWPACEYVFDMMEEHAFEVGPEFYGQFNITYVIHGLEGIISWAELSLKNSTNGQERKKFRRIRSQACLMRQESALVHNHHFRKADFQSFCEDFRPLSHLVKAPKPL